MENLTPRTRTEFKAKYYPSNDYSFISDKFNLNKPNNLQLKYEIYRIVKSNTCKQEPISTNRKINAGFEGKYYPSNNYFFIDDKFNE